MKIRTDFVTNSSSSSFILAKKQELSDKQKEAIINYVQNNMLGERIASTKEELDQFFSDEYYENPSSEEFKDSWRYSDYQKCLQAINKGLTIYSGYVSFECDSSQADLLNPLWRLLSKTDKDFIEINTSLDY